MFGNFKFFSNYFEVRLKKIFIFRLNSQKFKLLTVEFEVIQWRNKGGQSGTFALGAVF